MQSYQLYTFTQAGAPRPGRDFSGYDDADALSVAGAMARSEHAEVWQGARWVGMVNPPGHFWRGGGSVWATSAR